MKKILLLIISLFSIYAADAQCVTTAILNQDTIDCGDSVNVTINSFARSLLTEVFGPTGPNDPGWAQTAGAIYTNPFIPSPTNDTYFWMGATAVLPAALVSNPFNVQFGGQICFDFAYAVQGGAAPTEGPDLSEEGITLQYSIDGGVTWLDIQYMMPNGEFLPSNPGPNFPMNNPPFSATGTPFTVWNTVCFPLPVGALTSSTAFQWIQEFNSGACCDHWGLDNIQILAADPAYGLFDAVGNFLPSNTFTVFPTGDTTLTYIYTNGIDDTCFTSASVVVNPTNAGPDIQVACDGLGTQFAATGVAPWATVTWSPTTGVSNVNDPNSFVLPLIDTEYILTSDCGVDTITVYVEDSFVINIVEPDTICLNGSTFLNLSTTPSSVPIASVQWSPSSNLNSPTGNQVLASPLATTTYIATVTSDSGCVIQDSVIVNVQGVAATISVTPQDPRVCSGGSVTLTAAVNTPSVPYTLVQGAYNPYPTTGTNVTGLTDDNFIGPIPIGFIFPFFGNSYNQLYVGSNGFISLSAPSGSFLGNAAIPNAAQPNNIIAWGWDDLNFAAGGTFNYFVGGTPPNQYMVLNFLNVPHFGSAVTISVQVVIYQNGLIEINNINVVPDNAAGTMTQGIENSTGSAGLTDPSLNNTAITSIAQNWSFVPYTAPANAVYSWTPPATLSTIAGPVTTATPLGQTEYFVTMVDGFCSSTTSVTIEVDTLRAVGDFDYFLECPVDSFDFNVQFETSIFNDIQNGPSVNPGTGVFTQIQIGSGTATTASTPYFGFWEDGRQQLILTAAELNAAGFTGGNMSSLAFNVITKASTAPYNGFRVAVKATALTVLTGFDNTGGFTQVVNPAPYTTIAGWNTHVFNTIYSWDGVSNLIIETCFDNAAWTSNDLVQATSTVGNLTAYDFQDGAIGCSLNIPTQVTARPNVRINYENIIPGYAPISAQWTPSASFVNDTIENPTALNVNQSGEYYITLTAGACVSVDTVTVLFGAGYTASNDTSICIGDNVQLLVTGGSNHVWTPNDGSLSSTTIPNPVATPTNTTSYIVNLDLVNCSVADTINVSVNLLPVSLINNGEPNAAVCDGSIANLVSDADSAWTNNWTGPETGSGTAVDVSQEGIYILTSTDVNGCVSSSTITVSFNDNPIIDPNVIRNILCCNGDEVTVIFQDLVTNGVTIDEAYWDNGVTPSGVSVAIASNEDGTYDIRLVSDEGCEGTAQVTFQTNCLNPNIVDQDSVIFGGTTVYDVNTDLATDSELWTPNFTSNTFTANTVANDFETIFVETGAIYVLNDGSDLTCVESDSSQIFVFLIADPEFPNAFTPNGDNVNNLFFPVNLDPNATITAFRVYNRWGDAVYEYNSDNGWDGKWNGADQPVDVYTYYLVVDKTSEKFVTTGTVTLIR
jgi:gliding motility-associated-like protein